MKSRGKGRCSIVFFRDDTSCKLAIRCIRLKRVQTRDRDLETGHAAGCIEVPAVVLNLGALINRDLDLPLIVSQFKHRRDQLTYAACDLGAA
jgi:hypothetical protein